MVDGMMGWRWWGRWDESGGMGVEVMGWEEVRGWG